MAELVLRPLGMTDSTYEQPLPARLAGSAASGHRRDGTAIPGHSHTYPEMAAAGLWTTPTDLARFALEVQRALNGKAGAIPAATAREMATEVKDGYGLGLSLSGSGPEARFGHGGSNAGFKCQMTAFVSGGRGAVIMTNGDRGSALAAEIVRAIAREYGWPAFKPVEKTVVPLEAAALAAFEGQYELSPTRVVGLRVIEGKLFVLDGPERVELFAESATKFFDLVQQNSLEFSRGADGEVTGIVINGTTKARRLR
jgi:CubicO group peptidase (beta-lactamase class C family)